MAPSMDTPLGPDAMLALDALSMEPVPGVPSVTLHAMDIGYLERVSGHESGSYRNDPDTVYLDFQRTVGTCSIDQYIAHNPLTMAEHGYGGRTERGASTGADQVVLDGIVIDSAEAVVDHLERVVFPGLRTEASEIEADADAHVAALIAHESEVQRRFGPDILKVPYSDGFQDFPHLRYTAYGYVHYLTAFVMYPEVMEQDFALQADLAAKRNALAARAIREGGLPAVIRLDHDMADSRGTLVDVKMLDDLWFPHFARAIQPLLDGGVRLIWHCDGNLMAMVPRLIEAGVAGFQGFQYEDGMDYERICRMTTRDGDPLMIWAGVSVTRTLPFGTPDDVRKELDWLVDHAPPVGFFLGASSSVTPRTPHANLDALVEGLRHYRTQRR
ncbi:MAG: hypothetical protein GY851_30980 [bacterium]|nr:hypothetical protein [bacterium]